MRYDGSIIELTCCAICAGDGSHPVHPQVVHTAHPGQVQANVTVQNQNVAADNHTNRENELVIQEGNGDTEFEGLEFGNLNEAWKYYKAHAHSAGFSARKRWARKYDSANRKSEIVHYVQFVCNKEGEKKEPTPGHDNRKGKRAAVRTGCEAAFRLKLNKKKTAYILTYWNKEHNHELHPPEFVHMIRSNRSVNEVQGLVAKMNADCGIKLRSSYEVMALASGGKESLGFLHMDLKNHLGRKRQKDMAHGEATAMYEYFREKARLDPGFFYEVEVDSEESVANIFWADGRMRTDYACFGDAITFDTTFRTNKQYRPLGKYIPLSAHMFIHFRSCLLSFCPPGKQYDPHMEAM